MVLIKRIDRYIFTELIWPFVGGMLGAFIITSFGPLLRAIKLLTRGKVPPEIIAEWFIFRIPEDMQYIFPVAIMLSTLLTFGNLSKNSEITAMRAAGISLGRLLYPVACFGLLVTFGVFLFLDAVVPPSIYRSQRIWEREIRKETEAKYKENILLRSKNGGLLYIGRLDLKTNKIDRMLIREYLDENEEGPASHRERLKIETAAKTARWKRQEGEDNIWSLEGVRFRDYRVVGGVGAGRFDKLDEHRIPEGIEDLTKARVEIGRESNFAQERSFSELMEEIRYLDERGLADTAPLKVELYLKTSFPFCILIFALIGATMGISSHRSGGFIGFGISLVVTFLYYIALSLSSSVGKTGMLDPFWAAWLHNIGFFIFAIYNVVRVQSR